MFSASMCPSLIILSALISSSVKKSLLRRSLDNVESERITLNDPVNLPKLVSIPHSAKRKRG